jgi:hypothetical protein
VETRVERVGAAATAKEPPVVFWVAAVSQCARERINAIAANMNKEKLTKMASAVRTGGKGSVRRY